MLSIVAQNKSYLFISSSKQVSMMFIQVYSDQTLHSLEWHSLLHRGDSYVHLRWLSYLYRW